PQNPRPDPRAPPTACARHASLHQDSAHPEEPVSLSNRRLEGAKKKPAAATPHRLGTHLCELELGYQMSVTMSTYLTYLDGFTGRCLAASRIVLWRRHDRQTRTHPARQVQAGCPRSRMRR